MGLRPSPGQGFEPCQPKQVPGCTNHQGLPEDLPTAHVPTSSEPSDGLPPSDDLLHPLPDPLGPRVSLRSLSPLRPSPGLRLYALGSARSAWPPGGPRRPRLPAREETVPPRTPCPPPASSSSVHAGPWSTALMSSWAIPLPFATSDKLQRLHRPPRCSLPALSGRIAPCLEHGAHGHSTAEKQVL